MGNSCRIQSDKKCEEVLQISKQVSKQPTKQNPLEQFNYDVKSHLDAFDEEFYRREFFIDCKDQIISGFNINLCTSLGNEAEENIKLRNTTSQANIQSHSMLSQSAIHLSLYPTSSMAYVEDVLNKKISKSHQSLERTIQRAQRRQMEQRNQKSKSSQPKSILKKAAKNHRSLSPSPKRSNRNIVRFNLQQDSQEKQYSNSSYKFLPKLVQHYQK